MTAAPAEPGPERVAFKTSLEIKQLLQQLAIERGTTITEVIETAVQLLAKAGERERK